MWEWHVWDHLIQDHDPTRPNYGVVADHPEKIDVNFVLPGNQGDEDWNHANAVTYNPVTDEVMISSRSFSELWVIDHSTTIEEAAGPAGDLRFRVGNPAAYDRGTAADQELFVQHDPEWIPKGSPGAGDITVFSNGLPKVREYSTVEQIHPVTVNGAYVLGDDGRFAATVKRVLPHARGRPPIRGDHLERAAVAQRQHAARLRLARTLRRGRARRHDRLGVREPPVHRAQEDPDPDGRRLRDRAVVDLPHPPLRARLSRTGRARELTARAPAQRSRRSASPATVTISSATSPSAWWTGSGTRPRVPATGNTVAITPVSTCAQCAPALRSTARIARFS